MVYRMLADTVLVIHFLFIILAVFGGLLIFKWKRFAWLHVPVVIWATLIEFYGWICPLTYLEVWLLEQGNMVSYGSGFIERYIVPIIYPEALTHPQHILVGLFVFMFNLLIYGWIFYRGKFLRSTRP